MFGRYLFIFLIGYLLYKLVKPNIRKYFSPPSIEKEKKKKALHVDKSDIVDAEFKDLNNDNSGDS